MQVARHDAEPAARPGHRDGAAWPPAVDLRGVYKSFGPVQAVRGVALAVGSGEVMAFLGPNGAGKTSTIDMILGLSRPDAGEVEVYGMAPRQAVRRGLVSAVMQSGGLLEDLTVAETVQYTAGLFAVSRPVGKCWGGPASPRSRAAWSGSARGRTAAAALRHGADPRPPAAHPRRADPGNGRGGPPRLLEGHPR